MAKWGERAAAVFAVSMMIALGLTFVGGAASASGPETVDGLVTEGLVLEAGIAGDGSQVMVDLTGCPPGSDVRILIDGYPVGDYPVPGDGRLTVTVDIPSSRDGNVIKAWCWATSSYVIQDIDQGGDPDDPDKPGDPGEPGDPGDGGNPFEGRNCLSYGPEELSGLPVSGNTFIADQSYGLVGLFYSVDPLLYNLFEDVAFGDELVADGKILKVVLCDPGGKPGYTPGDLIVKAYLEDGGKTIFVYVQGCPAGEDVDLFVDGVYQTTVVSGADDTVITSIPTPPGGTPETLRAECGERAFGVAPIWPDWRGPGDASALRGKVLVGGDIEGLGGGGGSNGATGTGGEVVSGEVASDTEFADSGVVFTVSADKAVADAEAIVVARADAEAFQGAVGDGKAFLALEDGVPDGGVEGLGVKTIFNPAASAQAATSAAETTLPAAQVALGALSAAGLLAFLGLRRVSRSMPGLA